MIALLADRNARRPHLLATWFYLVAAAARDKALWAFAAAFEEKAAHVEYTTGPPSGTYIIDQEDWWALRNALAGSERPKT